MQTFLKKKKNDTLCHISLLSDIEFVFHLVCKMFSFRLGSIVLYFSVLILCHCEILLTEVRAQNFHWSTLSLGYFQTRN